jgi:hypothetical protein
MGLNYLGGSDEINTCRARRFREDTGRVRLKATEYKAASIPSRENKLGFGLKKTPEKDNLPE